MKKRIISCILAVVMCLSVVSAFAGCTQGSAKPDALVIMTESLDGLFNPFYSTTGPDATIVSMTQIAMLSAGYENGEVVVAYGDDEAVVAKDYSIEKKDGTTVYTFIIKNGILFSDGKPLTMNDVMFNLYVYLDPVYSGSSTMYSTDIVGLQAYRTQETSSDGEGADDRITEQARSRAQNRINELINLYKATGATATAGSYDADYDKMVAAINAHSPSSGYTQAIDNDASKVTNKNLLEDYELTLKYFEEELGRDYESAKDSYTDKPYSDTNEFDEITSFMYTEGFVTIEYEKDPVTNKDLKDKIKKVIRNYGDTITTKEAAIKYVYDYTVTHKLDQILTYWATAQELQTEYMSQAKQVILHASVQDDGNLLIPNISGIVSLGHTTETESVTIGDNTYKVAHEHNEDGTVKNSDEYDVLQITINGVDPKAIWNFAFSVAPQHYYAEGCEVDIANNKFGVEYGSFDFMKDKIQSPRNVKVPVGAGAYKATNSANADNPEGNEFFSNNVVYFKANDKFLLGTPNIEKVRYQVVSSSNALNALESGSVHFVTPQFTQINIDKINSLASKGIESTHTKQLGYGYIGINAGKVPDIDIRKAIMCAMDTSLALSYYSTGMAEKIYWPMSTVSWAYPQEDGNPSRMNDHEYPAIQFSVEDAKKKIESYMSAANVSAGDSKLSIKFTIAGANLTEHPTYQTFQGAADLLNELGWDIEVVPDTQSLTKLSSGSLAVWAAAWGTTVDPDMYQVYHKNSTATSTLAWGYREILASPSSYPIETGILNQLSDVIDAARETEDRAERTALYEEAMGYVLDLAIELPVYQREVLYAYNANVIDSSSLPEELNPYSSPLDHLWELKFAE